LVGVAEYVILVPAHCAPAGEAEILTDAGLGEITSIIIVLLDAGLPLTQPRLEVTIHCTVFPLTGALVLKVEPVQQKLPFMNHWYDAEPPFTALAVQVTLVPAQTWPGGFWLIVAETGKGVVIL
jgi:hypothetical protein